MWELVCVLVLLVITAAAFFEWGRAHMRVEVVKSWKLATCHECGSYPLPTMIHRSGCKTGWPPDGTQHALGRIP